MSDAVRLLVGVRLVNAVRARVRPSSPVQLARRLDPRFVVTPTIRRLSDIAVRSVTSPDQRDVVSTPPRTGKSRLLAIWTSVWALMRNPDTEVVIVSYSDELAQAHSREALKLIREHAEFLGFRLAADKTAVGRWRVEGRRGGMLATGINSGVTGFGADLMIIDDPVKDAAEADSAAHRRRVLNEYRSTLSTRIHPGGSVVVVMTRWHEQDLAGALLDAEPERWARTNIPAVSDLRVPDALGRRRGGVAMVSALGFTAEHFSKTRSSVGERVWNALYMGVPSAPEGGLVKAAWLDGHRLDAAPRSPVLTVVAVDPSDSGEGDSCGLVAVSQTSDGKVALIADRSAPMTSDAWATAAVRLAAAVGASEIAVEGFSARETYSRVVREAIARESVGRALRVSMWPPKGASRVGDAVARSAALLQALEVGTCVMAGHHPDFEAKAVTWQAGKHQPDSLAALVIGHDVVIRAAGAVWGMASPVDSGSAGRGSVTDMGDWMRLRVG